MVAFLRTFFAVILAFMFLAGLPLVLALLLVLAPSPRPRDDTWLTIRLAGPVLEHYGPVSLRDVLDEYPPSLMEITENLEKAAVDDRIEGVIFRLDWFGAGLGKLDEIRAGVRRVQAAGKSVYAYSSVLRDGGLYLGSECDSLFLFPKGQVYFLGRGAAIEHLKGTLEKLGVREQIHRIDEYKSAAELYTSEKSSPETIENLKWVLKDLDRAYRETLSENLELSGERLEELRAQGVFSAESAVQAGLVHELLYWDELCDRLRGDRDDLRTISSADYSEVDRESVGLGGKTRVAVVHAQGFVASGGDDRYGPVEGLTMGTDRVVEDLRRVADDDRIKAILVRWDTGGGATDGAQRIARAVARAREEKPVVVSIADHAASGGYMMSYPANHILCPANGITGSIGSIIGKFNTRGLWEKLGVTFDDLAFAPNAFLLSSLHDWTPRQRELMAEAHWDSYNAWVADIAKSRDLTFEQVDGVSRGRVWTGRQAKERDLVDDLGGFEEALAWVRRLADLEESEEVSLVHYPEKQTLFDLLRKGDFGAATAHDALREVRRALALPRGEAPPSLHLAPFRLD